jgi:hypothetical protein
MITGVHQENGERRPHPPVSGHAMEDKSIDRFVPSTSRAAEEGADAVELAVPPSNLLSRSPRPNMRHMGGSHAHAR